MASKKQVRDTQHELNVLESKVRLDGVGEDQAVKDLMSDKFVHGTDLEAGKIALALAEIITGIKANSHQQNVIMERLSTLQRAQDAWTTDKEKFLADVEKRAQSLLVTSELEKDKIKTKWAKTALEARQQAAAELAVSALKFEELLKSQPTEQILSSGILEMHREGDAMVPYIAPEIIAIKNKKWSLPPGQTCVVPKMVADEWRARQKQRQMMKERQELMKDGAVESASLVKGWGEINEKYGQGGDSMPSPV